MNNVRTAGSGQFFVPGIKDINDFDGIRSKVRESAANSPVDLAFNKGGRCTILGTTFGVPFINLNKREIGLATLTSAEGTEEGVFISLPKYLFRVQAAWELALAKGQYNMRFCMKQFSEDLVMEATEHIATDVMVVRLRSLQGQAASDIRLAMGEIGVSPKTAAMIQQRLSQKDVSISQRENIDGLQLLGKRFPVASPTGTRVVILRILEGVDDNKIHLNPVAMQYLHGGDFDGDLYYLLFEKSKVFGNFEKIGSLPRIEMYSRDTDVLLGLRSEWRESTDEENIQRVMGACIKELTGALTYMFGALARGYAMLTKNRREQKERYIETYRIFEPLMEAVMDAKKKDTTAAELYVLGEQVQFFLSGGNLNPDAFRSFLTDDLLSELRRIAVLCPNLSLVRITLTGSMVAAGQKMAGAVKRALGDTSNLEPNTLLRTFLNDAMGTELYHMKPGTPGRQRMKREVVIDTGTGTCLSRLEGLTVNGDNVISNVGIATSLNGVDRILTFRLHPKWLDGANFHWNIVVPLPNLMAASKEGHCHVQYGEGARRMFRPIFQLNGEETETLKFLGFVSEVIADTLKEVINTTTFRHPKAASRISDKFDYELREMIQTLPMSDDQADLLLVSEYEVRVHSKEIVGKWREREKLLRSLVGTYDINCTSKGEPGSVITSKGSQGVPRFMSAFSPFARLMDRKREPEMRELRQAVPLMHPTPLSVKLEGTRLPETMAASVRELTVVVMDCNHNYFTKEVTGVHEEFCHDTLLATPSFHAKMKLKSQTFTVNTDRELEELLNQLEEMGVDTATVKTTEAKRQLGKNFNGVLTAKSWRVEVELNLEDLGKIKGLGAIKGVPVALPEQLYAINPDGTRVEIDLVIPHTTFTKKKCFDAAMYMLAVKAGMKEVKPDYDVDEIMSEMTEMSQERGFNPDLTQMVEGIGEAIVGTLPFYRPSQTAFSLFRLRGKGNGTRVHLHDMIMADVENVLRPEDERRFAQIVVSLRELAQSMPTMGDTEVNDEMPTEMWESYDTEAEC